jgi:hypothetical protein
VVLKNRFSLGSGKSRIKRRAVYPIQRRIDRHFSSAPSGYTTPQNASSLTVIVNE